MSHFTIPFISRIKSDWEGKPIRWKFKVMQIAPENRGLSTQDTVNKPSRGLGAHVGIYAGRCVSKNK